MRKTVAAIIAGLAMGASIPVAAVVGYAYNHRAHVYEAQVCALDKAILRVLGRSGKQIPAGHKYDVYRVRLARDINDIQQADAC